MKTNILADFQICVSVLLNDEFGEENISLSKGTKITPRGSKIWKEMSSKEEEQKIEFLKVATQKLQKE